MAGVRAFHQATLVPSHVVQRDAVDSGELDAADWAFAPTYIHAYQGEASQPRLLLIGRSSMAAVRSPLVVDLETEETTTFEPGDARYFPLRQTSRTDADLAFFSRNGRIFRAGGLSNPGVQVFPHLPPYQKQPPYSTLCKRAGRIACLLPLGDWLYVPDDHCWYRIDPETLEEQPVLQSESAPRFHFGPASSFKLSAHYGILAWDAQAFGPTAVPTIAQLGRIHPYRQVIIHAPR